MVCMSEFLFSLTCDLFLIDTHVLINNEAYGIYVGVNPVYGIVFRDDLGYPVYNKQLTIKGGF